MATHATTKHTFITTQWDVRDPKESSIVDASVMHKQTAFDTKPHIKVVHIPHNAEMQTQL